MATTYAASGREMTVGGVLARAFTAIGAAPGRFLGTAVGVSVVSAALHSFVGSGAPRPIPGTSPVAAFEAQPWGGLLAIGIVNFVLYLLAKAILIRTAATVEGGDRAETYGESVAAALRVLPALLGGAILSYLGIWAGMILLIVPGVILALMWAVVGPVLVQERTGVVVAFGRSNALTKGARLRILGLYIVVGALYLVVLFTLGAGVGLGIGAAASPTILSAALGVVIQSAFLAAWTAVQAALYLELRDARDGVAGDRLADIFA